MSSLVIGVGIAVVVGLLALLARRRQIVDVPTQASFTVPSQIDRTDFGSPNEEWLVIVFTSSTCPVCADVASKVRAMSSRHVATRIVDYSSDRAIHDRYAIDAVPTVVIVDRAGVVQHHFLGPVTATDLWAAVASVRDGSVPGSAQCSHD